MDDIELMPCPFCGGNDLRVASPSEAWVTCEECDAEGPTAWATEEAVRKWNAAATLRIELAAKETEALGYLRAVGTLQGRIDKLQKALEPFAKAGHVIDGPFGPALFREDDMAFQSGCAWSENGERRTITWGDFRAARAALDQDKGGGNDG